MEHAGQLFDLRPVSLRRRRFLMVSVAVLAVLGMALGVSFMADSGSTTVTVTSVNDAFVFPVANSNVVPNNVTSLKYTTAINATTDTITTADLPGWTPVANSAGTVETAGAGDLLLVDATDLGNATAITVGMYVTNLDALQKMYSSYAWELAVYEATKSSCTSTCSWALSDGANGTADLTDANAVFLTHTDAFMTFSMPEGKIYTVTIEPGGSFYCTSTTATGGSLSPTFYFTGQPT